jgi:hypothetical protein
MLYGFRVYKSKQEASVEAVIVDIYDVIVNDKFLVHETFYHTGAYMNL